MPNNFRMPIDDLIVTFCVHSNHIQENSLAQLLIDFLDNANMELGDFFTSKHWRTRRGLSRANIFCLAIATSFGQQPCSSQVEKIFLFYLLNQTGIHSAQQV